MRKLAWLYFRMDARSIPYLAVTVLIIAGTRADAVSITVNNFSFETPDITNAVVSGVPTGWSDSGGGGDVIKYRDNYAPLVTAGVPDGQQWALITATGISAKHLSQNTGFSIVEGQTYTLTVAVGEQENQGGVIDMARIFLYGSTTGHATPFAILDNIDPIATTAAGTSAWFDYEASFTATAGQAGENLVIGLGVGSNIGGGGFVNSNVSFDNVRLSFTPVPEPSTALLGVMGCLLLARRRRIA